MGKHISKTDRQKYFLQDLENELAIQAAFRRGDRIKNNFAALVRDAQDVNLRNAYPKNPCYQALIGFLAQNEGVVKQNKLNTWFENLAFMAEQLEPKCPKWFNDSDYVKALIEVGKYRTWWIRPMEDWKPKAKGDYERFKELTHHLFAQYRVPNFLQHIFFHTQDHFFVQDFIYLAQGGSIKNIGSKVMLTNKMKAEFMKSPDGFRITEAFRYAQVIGWGGDEMLAHRLAYSWLGRRETAHEELWEVFVRILVAGGMFNHDKIGELIDYVNYEITRNSVYSLKGRTLSSLIRQSDQWHEEFSYIQRKNGITTWTSASFVPFDVVEGKEEKEVQYKIVELLSNKELNEEGQKMHHCVGSYSQYCVKGRTSIVSLRKSQFDHEERMATIEIDLQSKRIVQAKYRYNMRISEKALGFLHQWAAMNGLILGRYL